MRWDITLKGTVAEARELSEKYDLYMEDEELQGLADDLDPDLPRPLANEYQLVYAHYIAAIERDSVALNGQVVDGVTLNLADGEMVSGVLRDRGTRLAECTPEELAEAVGMLDELRDLDEPGPEWEMDWKDL